MVSQEHPRVLSATTLVGETVVNHQGEDLGKIEDLMVDLHTGRVAYAVLTFGGFLGVGNKLFAIPWSALMYDPTHKVFVLNVDHDRLKNAPGFDKDNWPEFADPRWATGIHSYYGAQPYWE
jgi:sporulation protein YlmC with PRC-barrel domain